MSDIRFNNWKHQSGTGGVTQNSGGNVGIGSTLPSSKLDVGGDVQVTGVVTATSFVGSGANLTGIDTSFGSGTSVNTTGIITAASASFTGNISVGGTLTYEDVTNIDSVGIVTARTGIKVLAGGINAVGVVTATSFVGDGSGLSGVESWNQFDTWLYGGG